MLLMAMVWTLMAMALFFLRPNSMRSTPGNEKTGGGGGDNARRGGGGEGGDPPPPAVM